MDKENINKLTFEAILASISAGIATLTVFKEEVIEVESKPDNSPLTHADLLSNNEIYKRLTKLDIPILSEEGKQTPYNERKQRSVFWLIDPLDGTKEFIKKSGEYTVNIALIENCTPVAGIIYVPVLNELYFANKYIGSYKVKEIDDLSKLTDLDSFIQAGSKLPLITERKTFRIVASKSHLSEETVEYIDKIKKQKNNIDFVSKGSSLKLCLIAEGTADLYPRFGPTMEWDIAAGHAIVKYAGGKVLYTNKPGELEYNKENLLNPFFIASRA